MKREYYACWFRLDGSDAYLIWYSNDLDGVILNADGNVPTFSDIAALQSYAKARGVVTHTENLHLHNLDAVQNWLNKPIPHNVNCAELLAAWNLFTDVKSTLEDRNVTPEEREYRDLYDKLFWGNNLPAVTPPGKHYEPIWSNGEITRLHAVISQGMALFRARVRRVANEAGSNP